MDELKDDRFGERIILKGQVDPFSLERSSIKESTAEVKLTFLDKGKVEKKGDVREAVVDTFHKDVSKIVTRVFGDETPEPLGIEPASEVFESEEPDLNKFNARVVWREGLRGRKGVNEDYSDKFSWREIEVQRLEVKSAVEGVQYSLIVRYLHEDEEGKKKYGNEFILTLDQRDLTRVKGASVWEYSHDANAYDSQQVMFNEEGKVTKKGDLPKDMGGREDVIAEKDVDVVETFKHWVQKMPGLKVK
jgi:hypothetical protein